MLSLAVLLGLLLAPSVAAQEPEPVAGDVADAERAEAPIAVETALVDREGRPFGPERPLRLGDEAILRITVTAEPDIRVFVPSNPAIEPFRLLGERTEVEEESGAEGTMTVHRFPVMPLRTGAKNLEPVDVVWRTAGGDSGSVSTERLLVHVAGRLTDVQDPPLGPAPAPVPVITTNWVLVWALSVVGAGALATLLTVLLLRILRGRLEQAAPPPPPRPADEVALEKLAALREAELDPVERYAAIANVLREYLGGRYGFDGLDLTTRELMARLDGADLKAIPPLEIRGLLADADLVKFARFEPGEEETLALIDRVQRIVEVTWVPPEPEVEPALVARLEPASVAERARAGLVDLALATAVGLVVMGALWSARLLEWGWTGVLAVGVVLWLRDVAGAGSPGKTLCGLRLVRQTDDQRPPTVRRRLWRNLPMLLAPLGVPVHALTILYHPLHRGAGDLLAGTEVVRGGGR